MVTLLEPVDYLALRAEACLALDGAEDKTRAVRFNWRGDDFIARQSPAGIVVRRADSGDCILETLRIT